MSENIPPFSNQLRILLKEAREATGSESDEGCMSKPELARKLQVSERTIRRVENGHTQTVPAWLIDRWLRVCHAKIRMKLEQ